MGDKRLLSGFFRKWSWFHGHNERFSKYLGEKSKFQKTETRFFRWKINELAGVNTERKSTHRLRKVPKLVFSLLRLHYNDDPMLSLRSPNKLTLHLFIIFSLLCSHYVTDLIKKLEMRLMVVSVLGLNLGKPKLVCPKWVYWCWKQSVSTPDYSNINIFLSLWKTLLVCLYACKRKDLKTDF